MDNQEKFQIVDAIQTIADEFNCTFDLVLDNLSGVIQDEDRKQLKEFCDELY
jgi:hypothetical protein